jgi:hypothetical protein
VGGTITGTIGGDPINEEYDDFIIVFSSDAQGMTITINGSINAGCLGDWTTITTVTPVFIPDGAQCPTAGEIHVTAGGDTVKMVINANGTVDVFFNDTLVQSYADCEVVDGLCLS